MYRIWNRRAERQAKGGLISVAGRRTVACEATPVRRISFYGLLPASSTHPSAYKNKDRLSLSLSFLALTWFPPLNSYYQIEDLRLELQRKEQELMQMQAKMKTVEEQHADFQKHIAVLKESLIAKEEHYNMLQIDVSDIFLLGESNRILIVNERRKLFSCCVQN